jgi:hypothetical protein
MMSLSNHVEVGFLFQQIISKSIEFLDIFQSISSKKITANRYLRLAFNILYRYINLSFVYIKAFFF